MHEVTFYYKTLDKLFGLNQAELEKLDSVIQAKIVVSEDVSKLKKNDTCVSENYHQVQYVLDLTRENKK